MNPLLRILICSIFVSLTTNAALAQSSKGLAEAEAAYEAAWLESPLTFRKVVLINEANGFGIYEQRKDAVFKGNEPILVYAEPVGYAWKDNGDGTFAFGFNIDLLVKTPDGKIVAGQENFQKFEFTSRAKNKEFLMSLQLNFTGAPPGEYVIEYTTRDLASRKIGKISFPVWIVN